MIVKIQSYTDVITNSSSTVFVMNESDANYYLDLETYDSVSIQYISYDWILGEGRYEAEMICDLLNEDISNISTCVDHKWYSYWETPDEDVWKAFCESHEEQIKEVFKDLYWVDIEDHFEDAGTVIESAMDDSLWYENRH